MRTGIEKLIQIYLYIYWNTFFGDDKYINKAHSQCSSIYWVLIVMLLYSCITTDSDFFMLPGDTRGAISFSTNYLVFHIWYFAVYVYTLTSAIVTDGWIFAQYRIFLYRVQTWCYVLLVTSALKILLPVFLQDFPAFSVHKTQKITLDSHWVKCIWLC